MSNILVVAAHPDDEILGVGATIAKRISNGDEAWTLILGEGQTSRWDERKNAPQNVIHDLHQDALSASKCIGYKKTIFADFPDNQFDSVNFLSIIKQIEIVLKEYQPEIIYTHHGGDLNIDHQITFRAVITATRPMQNCNVKEIYSFETLSSTEWDFSYQNPFVPNVFEEVSRFMKEKQKAMSYYHSELCEFPHPRSLEALKIAAQKWGSVAGYNYAEAFMLVRSMRE